MTNDNASVQATMQQRQDDYFVAMDEGYEAGTEPLPQWYYEKPLAMLTLKERAYWFGREMKAVEEMK